LSGFYDYFSLLSRGIFQDNTIQYLDVSQPLSADLMTATVIVKLKKETGDEGMLKILLYVTLVCLLSVSCVYGHEEEGTDTPGVLEKGGQYLPADLIFLDENGKEVRLASILDKPIILTLVYYSCTDICPQILGGLAITLGNIKLVPGKDYKIVTVSFDKEDTPAVAKRSKGNYLNAIGKPFPTEAWYFLTGNKDNITRLTNAVGFSFKRETATGSLGFATRKQSIGFTHPSVLIFLAPGGKVTRYLYVEKSHYGTLAPIAFSNVEITTSLVDASQGRVWEGSRNPLRLCFPRLSENEARFFTLTASVGLATIICLAAFFFYLRRSGRKRPSGGNK
jgi:protein SCO1